MGTKVDQFVQVFNKCVETFKNVFFPKTKSTEHLDTNDRHLTTTVASYALL